MSGLLITWEGLDRVGKTTQLRLVADWLRGEVREVVTVREPGGTPFGEKLREVLLREADAVSSLAEFLAFAAARAELMETVVLPALARHAVVLMDRFIDSSVAYQAFGRGVELDVVQTVNRAATRGRMPDLTIWLKGEPFGDSEGVDRVEGRTPAYFRRVEAGYRWLSEQEPERWVVLDARQDPAVIFEAERARIRQILIQKGGDPR
ncbi:MAG: dTMP kinase [Firmicutes bacterium]|nr:dTMP kinase [Bacillota bacterium]